MRAFLPIVVVTCAAVSGGCTTAEPVDPGVTAALKDKPGGFVTGAPRGLGTPQVVNRRDFIYALAFGKDNQLAFVHHVTKSMELTATQIEPLRPRFQQPVNSSEFDVEDVIIVDDGPGRGSIAVPSRQGIARAFDAKTGSVLHEYIAGIGLVRVALSPDHGILAFGSVDGRVLLLDPGTFVVRGEARIHDDEVHGLAFLPDGRLLSTSFDGTLKVSRVVPSKDPSVRVAATALKTGERVFLAHLDGAKAISSVRDVRQPSCAITTAAVKRLSLSPPEDAQPLAVMTPGGPATGSPVSLGRVHVGTLDLGALTAAVCDDCVPPGAELVLGGPALARATFIDDVAKDEIIVKPTDAADKAVMVDGAVTLALDKTIALPGPGTDIDMSRAVGPGQVPEVLVSFSEKKAERSFDLYDREKKGIYPDPSPKSGAALVDLDKGALSKSFVGQHGFTTTAAISPDGRTVVTGGWDKRVLVFDAVTGERVAERELAWLVRRVRFSPDGHLLGVAAWTPVNALNEGNSDPALLLYPVALEAEKVVAGR